MAFPVAVQSAIFYFMACTPCVSARTRYRTRQKSRREREERAKLDAEEPQLYRQPSPFNVNPYWEEEIRMGPSLPKKGRQNNYKSVSQRKLTSAGQDSSIATRSSLAISNHGPMFNNPLGGEPVLEVATGVGRPPTGGSGRLSNVGMTMAPITAPVAAATPSMAAPPRSAGHISPTSMAPPSPTLVPDALDVADDVHSLSAVEPATTTTSSTGGEGWNYKRYQREDEELWGSEQSRTHKLMDAIVKAGSSAGRLLESTLGKDRTITDEDRANFYTTSIIHPPVNEYHPPVVSSKPAHKDALRWMLQPPPPAKVMEGKVPVSRSTSIASGASRKSRAAASDLALSRRLTTEERLGRASSSHSARPRSSRQQVADAANAANDAKAVDVSLDGGDRITDLRSGSPNRSVSRKSARSTGANAMRPKSQRRRNSQNRNRSRSGSLTSSMEDPNWSSDEDNMGLKARWHFSAAAAASSSFSALSATSQAGRGLESATSATGSSSKTSLAPASAAKSAPVAVEAATTETDAASSATTATPSAQVLHAHKPQNGRLETILSSDSSSKFDVGPSGQAKENVSLDGPAVQSPASKNDSLLKSQQHDRPSGSSIDSGLALSA